jgi:hypothetical protein
VKACVELSKCADYLETRLDRSAGIILVSDGSAKEECDTVSFPVVQVPTETTDDFGTEIPELAVDIVEIIDVEAVKQSAGIDHVAIHGRHLTAFTGARARRTRRRHNPPNAVRSIDVV